MSEKNNSLALNASSLDLLFTSSPEELNELELVNVWSMLDLIEKIAKERKNFFRERMLEEAQKGEKNKKGSYSINIEGSTITAESRVSSVPDEEMLKQLLNEKNIKIEECFDIVKTLQFNPIKLDYLVQRGFLTEEEVEKCRKKSVALIVNVNKEIKNVLESVKSSVKLVK